MSDLQKCEEKDSKNERTISKGDKNINSEENKQETIFGIQDKNKEIIENDKEKEEKSSNLKENKNLSETNEDHALKKKKNL